MSRLVTRTRASTHAVFFGFAALWLAPVLASPAHAGPATPGDVASAPAFEGTFETQIADMVDGTSKMMHVLVSGDRQVELSVSPQDFPEILQRRAVVQAFGEVNNHGVLEVERLTLVSPPPVRSIDPEPFPVRRIAWIQVYWTGKDGLSKEEIKGRMFTGETSTNTYYQQISYGKEKIAGDVYGWFEINDPGGCNNQSIASQAQAALKASGVNIYDYDQFMYYFPYTGTCQWAGLANVGAPDDAAEDSWYNGSSGCVVRAQEIGHNYGMLHSQSLTCEDGNGNWTPLSDNCTVNEYGNPYDPMGGGCGHMVQYQKGFMGWLDGCNDVDVTADGTFNLLPTEVPCNGIQSLRLKIGPNLYYYLEYRQPLGAWDGPGGNFGNGLSGVLAHLGPDYSYDNNQIVDLNNGPGGFIHAGESYTDYQDRVSFEILEENPTHAVVQVTFPGGGSGSPVCGDGSAPGMEAGNIGSLECASGPLPHDDTPPVVTITYPEDGQYFEPGASFDIVAEATDDRGVTEAQLYVNSDPTFKDFGEPFTWHVDSIPAGTYEFGVVAKDGPNWAPSNAVTIYVQEGGDPTTTGTGTSGTSGTTGDTATTGGTTGGTTGSDTDSGTGGDQTTDDKGCGCRSSTPAPFGMLVLLLAATARRRRRP